MCEFFPGHNDYLLSFARYHVLDEVYYIPGHSGVGFRIILL